MSRRLQTLLYLFRRYRRRGVGDEATASDRLDRALATWACASLAAFVVGSLLAPPDPLSLLAYTVACFALTLPAAYALVYRGGYRRASARVRS